MAFLAQPVMLLNLFSGIVAGIWLALVGEWVLIGQGLLYAVFGHCVIGLLLVLTMPFAYGAKRLTEGGRYWLPLLVGTISKFGVFAIMALTSVYVFFWFTGGGEFTPLIPRSLWFYSTATAPWAYLAKNDFKSGTYSAVIPLATVQSACLLLAVTNWFLPARSSSVAVLVFGAAMLMGFILDTAKTSAALARGRKNMKASPSSNEAV